MKIDDIMNEDIEQVASESFTERVQLSEEERIASAKRAIRAGEKAGSAKEASEDTDDDDYIVSEDDEDARKDAVEDDSEDEADAEEETYAHDAEDDSEESYDADDADDADDSDDENAKDDAEDDAEDGEITEEPSKLKGFLRELGFFVACFLIIYAIFYVFPPYLVSGSSMNKTLTDKAFGFGFRYITPERGDIVIVNTGEKENGTDNANFIKRVIGVPGDTIKCEVERYEYDVTLGDGTVVAAGEPVYRVYVNGVLEEVPYASYTGGTIYAAKTGEWTLAENEFFVMGDNRFNSHDSRSIGPVTKDEIVCKMLFFLWGKHD